MNRVWELELDVDSFDLEEEGKAEEELDGVDITTLQEVGTGEKNKRKTYGLFEEIMEDVPSSDEWTGWDYDQFIERIYERPVFSPDCTIIAEKDDRFIGMIIQYYVEEENDIYTGIGGVRREHRDKGVATAMLTRAVKTAEKKGVSKMKTESRNESVLKILQNLGFDKKPGRIQFEKVLE
ncbi:MAG: GNAT family N-acetyltransferase [Candidatus Natronoplasma sp.]